MGVTKLWTVLKPAKRTIKLQSLKYRRLAIGTLNNTERCIVSLASKNPAGDNSQYAYTDLFLISFNKSSLIVLFDCTLDASIWLTSFVKAMRDADGNTIHNAHLKGLWGRICKLLIFGMKYGLHSHLLNPNPL